MHAFAGCNTITSETFDVGSLFSHIWYLKGIRVKFVYEGHPVKVKVTGAKVVQNPYSRNLKLPSAITPVL